MPEALPTWLCPSCHQPTDPKSNLCDHCRYLHLGRLVAGVAPAPSVAESAAEEEDDSAAAPGWYEDPRGSGQRWWDGERWGRRLSGGRSDGTAAPENDGLATIGWITAVLIPFVGLVVGIMLSSRNDRRGTPIALTAVGVFVAWGVFWVILNVVAASSVGY